MTNLTLLLEIGFIASIALVTVFFHLRFDRFSVVHGPEVLTTMGILGCFTGITVALFSFNPNDIQASVPTLLGGIRTAFWASLAGVFGALTLRFAQRFRKIRQEVEDDAPAGNASLNDVVVALQGLRKAITGPEPQSLTNQIEAGRNQSATQSEALITEFRSFAHHMVENNQKAIIEALESVIRDFNDKLSSQFGDNFKQLNQAVERLVVWQQQYKEELDLLQSRQREAAGELAQAAATLQTIVASAGQFEKVALALAEQIEFLNNGRDMLLAQQRALADVLAQMSSVTPTFAQKTTEMLSQLEQGLGAIRDKIIDISGQMAGEILKANQELRGLVAGSAKTHEEELARVQQAMSRATENLGVQMQLTQADFRKQITEVIGQAQDELKKGLQDNARVIKEGVLALDKGLQKELNDALEALAGQLAALSNRFVEDYLPLTERLREVVQMARKI
ncbi:MAG: hypothetical protein RLZZ344_745 [Pseudomonadota bacterium]|jgi:3-dehydroquinate dehydratase